MLSLMKVPTGFKGCLCYLIVCLSAYSTAATPSWLEAECAQVGDNWQVQPGPSAGEQYCVYPSDTRLNSPSTNPADHLVFSVEISTTGSYHLQAYIRAASGTQDSFWFKIDDGDWVKWWRNIKRGNQFAWNTAPGGPFSLEVGPHTITIAYREAGTQIDKIYISENTATPDGPGPFATDCSVTEPTAAYWIEAECGEVGSDWQQGFSSEAANGQFVFAPTQRSTASPPSNPRGWVNYEVNVDEAGTFYLFARMKAVSLAANSFWFRIDDQPWVEWWKGITISNQFAWNRAPGKSFGLSAGTHTITFAYREGDTQLDKILLRSSGDLPSGLGEEVACSPNLPPAVSHWIEAECAELGRNWTEQESAAASGNQYVVYPRGKSLTVPPFSKEDQLILEVEVEQEQVYYLLARINAPTGASNSLWVRVDDRSWIKWWRDISTGTGFTWNLLPSGPLDLSAGKHTITIAYREAGTQLDKLVLSTDATLPAGLGEPSNPCSEEPGEGPLIAAPDDTLLIAGQPYQQTIRAIGSNSFGRHVVVLGSSTAAGTGATSGKGWVELTRQYLLSQFPRSQLTNLAVGGYTTRDVLPSGNANHNITQALSLNPSLIIVNLPSNDVAKGVSDQESINNFAALNNVATAAGVPIYFTTTQPRDFSTLVKRQRLAAKAVQIKSQFAPSVIDIYSDLADNNLRIKGQYSSGDGIHLNNAGHQIIFTAVRALLDEQSGLADEVRLSVSGLPSFLTFTAEGSGVGTLRGTPSVADIGTYRGITIEAVKGTQRSQRAVTLVVVETAASQSSFPDQRGASTNLILSPNPADGYVIVQCNHSEEPTFYRIQLFSPQNELLFSDQLLGPQLRLDTRGLPNGYYPLRVYQQGRLVFSEQLIVDH